MSQDIELPGSPQARGKGQVVYLNREDSGVSPVEQLFVVAHHCDPHKDWKIRNFPGGIDQVLAERKPDEIIDAVIFPVGAAGHGYPYETPFPCPAECMACDKAFVKWFAWKRPAVLLGLPGGNIRPRRSHLG